MKRRRFVIPLTVAAAFAAMAFAWWRGDKAAVPAASPLLPAPVVRPQQAEPALPPSVVLSDASAPQPPGPASAVPERQPPDVSRMQREIQMAVSGDQRGKAGEAARHILRCLDAEDWATADPRGFLDRSQFEADRRDWLAANERLLRACQAVDAASRAQLVPLLRRSFAEGDKGAAAKLALAMWNFEPAAEPAVVAALRRDAWDCDRQSVSYLSWLAGQHAQILTPNELGALRAQMFEQIRVKSEPALRKSLDDAQLKEALAGMQAAWNPPPGANPTEVARMAADIQSRCKPDR